jgi:WD40 repeat protein
MRKVKFISITIFLMIFLSISLFSGINGQTITIEPIGHLKTGDFASGCPIDISDDGETLAVAMDGGSSEIRLTIVDMEDFEIINLFFPNASSLWLMNIGLNPTGTLIAVTDFFYFRIFTVPDLELEEDFSDSINDMITPRDVAWSPDGRLLAVGLNEIGRDITVVTIYDTSNWTRIEELEISSSEALALDWSFDGTMLACAGDGTTNGIERLDVWDTSDWTRITSQSLNELMVYDMAFNPAGSQLAVGGSDSVQIWNTTDWSSQSFGGDVLRKVSFSRDGELIMADSVIWTADDLSRWGEFPDATHAVFSPAFDEAVTVTFNGDIYKYDSSEWSGAAARDEDPDFDEPEIFPSFLCSLLVVILILVVIAVIVIVIILFITVKKNKSKKLY